MAVPPAPVRVPSQRPLAPSVTSVTSVANDDGDNEMIPGTRLLPPNEVARIAQHVGKGEGRKD